MMRNSEIRRKTRETEVRLALTLDGTGVCTGSSGVGFFDHLLELFCRHAGFDIDLACQGDLWVDAHHTVEDLGLVLGEALREALGDKKGIRRYGDILLPMDEVLVLGAVDLSGRPYLNFEVWYETEKSGDFEAALLEEFCRALTASGRFCLHLVLLEGGNTHHVLEGCMKALARCLGAAVSPTGDDRVPSSKGVL